MVLGAGPTSTRPGDTVRGVAVDPFSPPLPERMRRWPRRTQCRYFGLPLAGPAVRTRQGHWLEPLATVLNTCYHDPHVLAALASGVPAPISNQGMVLAELTPAELDPGRVKLWEARTGAPLVGPVMLAAPAWLRESTYVPREDLLRLLAPMVHILRETSFPWLFTPWPCALVPAPGEEALLRALEARAARWDDDLLSECEALGLVAGHALAAQRRTLAAWGLPRLVALLDAVQARADLVNDRGRWDEVRWSARSMAPPVSLRWYLDGVAPPDGLAGSRWLGACEAIWQRVATRPTAAGARGEWVLRVHGRRVALAWAVEHGTAMLTAWRPAGDAEPDTPTLPAVDQARETAAYHESCRLFARIDPMRDHPTARDRAHLAWLARAWDALTTITEADDHRRARRSLLLALAGAAGLFAAPRRDALRALLTADGHDRLLSLQDAASTLRTYLESPERRTIVGVGRFRDIVGAWVSPTWFMQDTLRDHPAPLAFTARCEAALHGVTLGPTLEGQVHAEIDGTPRTLRWRRDLGLVPALCSLD